jgi:hypothetical protein
MVSTFAWVLPYISHQLTAVPELVCSEKDLLVISALGDHEFLFTPLEPIFYIHGVFGL